LGKIVYLRRDVEYLVTRTSGDRNRPSLSQVRSFEQVMCARSPWYERAADYVVDATGGSIEKEVKNKQEIKREVLTILLQSNRRRPDRRAVQAIKGGHLDATQYGLAVH
jgi:shikimate kinase